MTADPLDLLAGAARDWGAPLDADALGRLSSYLAFVKEKNELVNLTADDAWDDLVLKHGADGPFAVSALRPLLGRAPRILDLGSGAGFVGIGLKLAWPEAEVTLMESVERKYRFLNAAAARLGVPGLKVLHRRAGDGRPLTAYDSGFDAVVERALAPLPEAVRLAFPMLGPKGLFAAFQTDEPDLSEPALAKSLAGAGAGVLKSCAYRRPGEGQDRRLVIFARREN
jgi:16S rRNA (guanine527-N7)-methyltransferase